MEHTDWKARKMHRKYCKACKVFDEFTKGLVIGVVVGLPIGIVLVRWVMEQP